MKRARRAYGEVDDTASHERPAIIDATAYRIAGMGDSNKGSDGSRAMRACHFAATSGAVIIGGKTILRADGTGIGKQESKKQDGTPHGQELA